MTYRSELEDIGNKSEKGLLTIMVIVVGATGWMLGAFSMGYYFTHRQETVDVNTPVRLVPPEPTTAPYVPKGFKPVASPKPKTI